MGTNRKNMAIGAVGYAATGNGAVLCGNGYEVIGTGNAAEAVTKACRNGLATAKGIALFFAAPFVGLAYIVAFPIVGLGMAAWFGCRALMKYAAARNAAEFAKWVAMILAAPLIGLAFVVLLPVIGAVALAWAAGGAAVN